MAHATVATLFHGGPPEDHQWGQVTFRAELASIPHISRADSFVGFNGSKFEDLNKSPVFGRGRLLLGLPWRFGLELAYTPPLEINGSQADGIYAIAIERPVLSAYGWQLGGRLFAQAGHVEGDITCPQAVVDFGVDDSINNPFGCRAASNDDAELDYHGVELSLSHALSEQTVIWAALAASRLEPEVQVEAELASGPDRARRSTRGIVRTTGLGIQYEFVDRWSVSALLNYTPLTVRRPPDRQQQQDDSVNFRVMLDYQLQ